MLVHTVGSRRRPQFDIVLNWSRAYAFSIRQAAFLYDRIPRARGVYCLYRRDWDYTYRRGHRRSPILYFGSGWMRDRIQAHLLHPKRFNTTLREHLEDESLLVRYAEVAEYDDEHWHLVAEGILVYEFERKYGELPPANRISPPARPSFDQSFIRQTPFDVVDEL